MTEEQVKIYLISNKNNFRYFDKLFLKKKLLEIDDTTSKVILSTELKSPLTSFIISFFLGAYGVDRIYIGQIGMGILKLFTFGGFTVWYFIDLFRIYRITQKINFNKISIYLN